MWRGAKFSRRENFAGFFLYKSVFFRTGAIIMFTIIIIINNNNYYNDYNNIVY